MSEIYIVILVLLFLFYILMLRLLKIERKIILIYKIIKESKNSKEIVGNYDIYDIPAFLRNQDSCQKEPIEETQQEVYEEPIEAKTQKEVYREPIEEVDNDNIPKVLIDVNYTKGELIEETEISDNIINFENYKKNKR